MGDGEPDKNNHWDRTIHESKRLRGHGLLWWIVVVILVLWLCVGLASCAYAILLYG